MEGDRIAAAAIALGPVAPRPCRAARAEAWLVGRPADAETIAHAGTLAREEAHPRDSLLRCSREYREAMVTVLVQSTLERAVFAALDVAEGGR
jgi:carbon-monoxide dehydrogenase medium subunit